MFELLQLARDCIEVEESPGHKLTNLETTGASVPIRTLDKVGLLYQKQGSYCS